MNDTLYKFALLTALLLFAAGLSGCGQKGPLYQVPDCSPIAANGAIRTLTDEDGNVLPPCTADKPREQDAVSTEDVAPLDDDLTIDTTNE